MNDKNYLLMPNPIRDWVVITQKAIFTINEHIVTKENEYVQQYKIYVTCVAVLNWGVLPLITHIKLQ